jgi:hypothetical protein
MLKKYAVFLAAASLFSVVLIGQERERDSEYAGALRSEDREVSNLGNSVRWRLVRNMMVTKDGNIAMACSGRNRVALAEIGK